MARLSAGPFHFGSMVVHTTTAGRVSTLTIERLCEWRLQERRLLVILAFDFVDLVGGVFKRFV